MPLASFSIRILIPLLLSVQVAVGQTQQIDSLTDLLQKENSDRKRLNLLLILSDQLSKTDALKGLEYANESVELASRLGSDSLSFVALGRLGNVYQYIGN